MIELDLIYKEFDSIILDQKIFIKARYGFTWDLEDGIVFAPSHNYTTASEGRDEENVLDLDPDGSSYHMLIDKVKLTCPRFVCPPLTKDGLFLEKKKTELDAFIKEHPKALLVFSTYSASFVHAQAKLAHLFPINLLMRSIDNRQLGDFFPIGGSKSRSYDIFRKSSLPATIRNRDKIKEAYSLFTDNQSKIVFLSIIRRYLFASDYPVAQSTQVQYFENVFTHKKGEVFVDCGGFTGDTLVEYFNLVPTEDVKEYIIFEPDPIIYRALEEKIASLPKEIQEKVTPQNCALGHESAQIQFDDIGYGISAVSQEGSITVDCVTLDDTLKGKEPSLLKFDIEGYEKFALHGGKEIISKYKPVIALCVYHHLFDLWELPLLLKNFVPDYHFVLRSYGQQTDYICYAIPKERFINR